MSGQRLTTVARGESRRVASLFPSFRDFVDDALFHPASGYYSTGRVRFGEGGHYDTFPLALSPIFGHMLAQYGYRFWRRAGEPEAFEICELGAGNGQLCRDVLVRVTARARREGAWRPFASALRYRIVERSRALIARQQEQMGALSDKVAWTRADLAQRAVPGGVPFTAVGMVFANEVLDCLAHHKVVQLPDGRPGAVFVVPRLKRRGAAIPRMAPLPSTCDAQGRIPRHRLAAVLADERLRRSVAFEEVALPIDVVAPLHRFVRRYYPEFYQPGVRFRPYFACPAIETLVANTSRLYRCGEILWVDYGDTRNFHLKAPEHQKIFAGPPCSGVTVYRAPGLDGITFLVDFSVVAG
ncbi:MAG: SAM-dependent methyltransferase, partial [Candidatus Binatia bacterium]